MGAAAADDKDQRWLFSKGPLTRRERQLNAFAGSILGLVLGIIADLVVTDATGRWLWVWIVCSMLACAIGGFYAPRWLVQVIAAAVMVVTC
jgi:uncharacterized membrane protein YccC